MTTKATTLAPDLIPRMDAWWRTANYLSGASGFVGGFRVDESGLVKGIEKAGGLSVTKYV